MTNVRNTVLYTGFTNNLIRRVDQHKNKYYPNSFSAAYNVNKLVYYEVYQYVYDAMARERQIKAGSRRKKIKLIESINPGWRDLSNDIPFGVITAGQPSQ